MAIPFQWPSGPKEPNPAAVAAALKAGTPANQITTAADMLLMAQEFTANRIIYEQFSLALAQIQDALGIAQPVPVLLSSDPVTGQQSIQLPVGITPDMLEINATNG